MGLGVMEESGIDRALTMPRVPPAAAGARHPLGLPDQAAPTTACTSSGRRSSRRPTVTSRPRIAARRRETDHGHRQAQGRVSRDGVRRLGLHLSPGVAAECRAAYAPPRHDGLRRSRPHDAVVSRACRGRARRPPADAQARVRTFSDCTTGPRLGLVPGCYPLDPFYVAHPHAPILKEAKAPART